MKTALLLAALLAAGAAQAQVNCGATSGRVNIVGNEFPAIKTVAANAAKCQTGSLTVKSNLTANHQRINLPGMQGNPAEYTSAIVATSSIVALINENVIRPLDALVAAHGQDIPKNQFITIDGKVMAVAFMANSQHLVYRKDLLAQVGAEPPKTYEDMIRIGKLLRERGIVKNPIGGAYKAGWSLAQEFVNMYTGHGGEFFKAGSAEAAINNPRGIAALNTMKALSELMHPDFLTHDNNETSAEWKSGNVALMNMWGSRTGVLMAKEGNDPKVSENTAVGAPMTVGGGNIPATTLWWDGWTVARNIPDEDARATFVAMKNGIAPSILTDQTMGEAVWMIAGYKPAPVNQGVMQTMAMGAKPYPMLPYMGLLHTALGDGLAPFLQGRKDAATTLADIEKAYATAAKEKGFLK
ncbi:MAG: extracellular solute-binding protein [Bosea sp.]|jgi:ABC-type glycerol-3-phosphate transport system substrate-binding protein|nr:extracellular solute-binding protein [Bosea sp. (in: a-proteobacteria)]